MPVTDTHRDPYTLVVEAEKNKRNWLTRNFGSAPAINNVLYYANATPVTPDANGNVVVKRNILIKFLPFIVFFFMAVGMYNIWFSFPRGQIFPGLIAFAVIWLLASIISVAVYVSKHKGFDVTVSKGGIEMGARYFFWKEIRATFLVDRTQGRSKQLFLVFVMQNDTLEYFDLSGFPTWTKNFKTLCTAIRDFQRPA